MSATKQRDHVVIIGGGLAGLTLALALSNRSIPCTVYELRPPSSTLGGAIMLSPNALRVLDSLGVYSRIISKGYNFETLTFKNENNETTDTYYFGHEKLYGYKALRIYRKVLVQELLDMLAERKIPVIFNKKFTEVVSETASDITFKFADGETQTAALLIGADGIHSRVRRYVSPAAIPVYSNKVAITYALPKSRLRFPVAEAEYSMPVTIQAKPGAFVLAPQNEKGTEVLAGTQFSYPEQDKTGWDALIVDKPQVLKLLLKDYKDWPDVAKSALEDVPVDTLGIWPFYMVPKLDRWSSTQHRAIVIGDAAHAIPPTAGQGANQAFEDAYSLALLLPAIFEDASIISISDALEWWQTYRQERVDKVMDLTMKMNNLRLPAAEREKLGADAVWRGGGDGQLKWLYEPKLEDAIGDWIFSRHK